MTDFIVAFQFCAGPQITGRSLCRDVGYMDDVSDNAAREEISYSDRQEECRNCSTEHDLGKVYGHALPAIIQFARQVSNELRDPLEAPYRSSVPQCHFS